MNKIGVVITTFNSESYFKELYDSLPISAIDELVIVNGGNPYLEEYACNKWIQHDTVKYASIARNDGLRYLIEQNCDYYFVIEDDMLITDPLIFQKYIDISQKTGIEYFGYASNAWNSGHPFNRTPRLRVEYAPDVAVNFFPNTCNEFTFRTKKVLEKTGLYDEEFQFTFDIDSLYRLHKDNFIRFWYFPDIGEADYLVKNNPNAVSRMNPNGERDKKISHNMELFKTKHGMYMQQVRLTPKDDMISFLKDLKINR